MKAFSLAAALLVAASLAGCGASAPTRPDNDSLARVDALIRQASGSLPVSLRLSADQIRLGDGLGASITPGVSGHVYLIQVGTDGRTQSLVFPNAIDGANFVPAGTALQLPRPNWRMTARGPAGVGYFVAVLSVQPLDLIALQASVQRGELVVPGAYGAAMATLRETAP